MIGLEIEHPTLVPQGHFLIGIQYNKRQIITYNLLGFKLVVAALLGILGVLHIGRGSGHTSPGHGDHILTAQSITQRLLKILIGQEPVIGIQVDLQIVYRTVGIELGLIPILIGCGNRHIHEVQLAVAYIPRGVLGSIRI